MGRYYNRVLLTVIICVTLLFGAFELASESGISSTNSLFIPCSVFPSEGEKAAVLEPLPTQPWSYCSWQNHFGISGLNSVGISAGYPWHNRFIGCQIQRFGYGDLYSEASYSITGGYLIRGRLLASGGVSAGILRIKDYGTASCFGVNIGWQARLAPRLLWGTTLTNLVRSGNLADDLPAVVSTGLYFKPGDTIFGKITWTQNLNYRGCLGFNAGWHPLALLQVMAGYQSNPGRLSAGFELIVQNIRIGYHCRTHQHLGLSHEIILGFTVTNR